MSTTRTVEQRIIRDLTVRQWRGQRVKRAGATESLITALAVTAVLLVLGSYAQELLWALLAGAGVWMLGTRAG